MTRETKVGLLFGMALILVIGILVSDFLVEAPAPAGSQMTQFGEQAQGSYADSRRVQTTEHAIQPREAVFPIPGQSDRSPRGEVIERPVERTPPSAAIAATRREPTLDELIERQRALDRRDYARAMEGDFQPRPYEDQLVIEREAVVREEVIEPQREVEREPVREQPRPQEIRHTVQRNESLYQIARQHYGNGEKWNLIRDANRDSVGPDGQVREGAELRIPVTDLAQLPQFERVDESRESTALTPSGTGHVIVVVQPGQTLGVLAAEHLGSSARWRELLEANRDQLRSDRDLKAGMELRVPTRSGAAVRTASAGVEAAQQSRETARKSYTVQSNDSLYRIAATQLGDGNRWRDIIAMNRDKIANENEIKPGMTLVLPAQ